MADPKNDVKNEGAKSNDKGEEIVPIKQSQLTEIMEGLARAEKAAEDANARAEGIEQMFANSATAEGEKKQGLRTQKNFEPKFRTVRLRKFPIAGKYEDQGYVIGWTKRGAYQEVDRSGVTPQIIDFIQVIFLDHEKNKNGELQAEKVKLLDLLNSGTQVHCKILEVKREDKNEPTGEEIDVSVFDPQHGLVSTGEKIDGVVGHSEIKYLIKIPDRAEPIWIDEQFVN